MKTSQATKLMKKARKCEAQAERIAHREPAKAECLRYEARQYRAWIDRAANT